MAVDINGDGLIALGGTSSTQGRLRLAEDTDNGTNYIELTAPASVASNRTITLPDATTTVVGTDTTQTLTNKSIAATQLTGTIASTQLPAGSVLQVVSATKTDTFSTSGTTFVDITGISVSITPKAAANKILIIATISIGPDSGAASLTMRFVRDSTVIAIGDAAGNRPRGTGNAYCGDSAGDASYVPSAISFLDSPNTTSATTYKVQANSSTASTVYVNRTDRDANLSGYDARTVSTITVMEIAG